MQWARIPSTRSALYYPLFEDEANRRYYVMLRRNQHPSNSRNAQEADSLLAWHPRHVFVPEKHDDWDIKLKRLALPICKDLSDEDRMKAGTVWADLGCDLLLVPSRSPAAGVRAHRKAAESLGRKLHGVVAVANQWDKPEKDSHCSLVHSPRSIKESLREESGDLHRNLRVDINFSDK